MDLERELIEIYKKLDKIHYATLGATGSATGAYGLPGFMFGTSTDEIMKVYVDGIYSLIDGIEVFIEMVDCTAVRLQQVKKFRKEYPFIAIG